ncbi:MAG: hypothetical protein ABGY95_10890 [Rubritalea sp.]|uniref:hypothetical protein n=1 Tax=Rubritalea sp. TaxID=2109375 RepID=UPI0032428B9B
MKLFNLDTLWQLLLVAILSFRALGADSYQTDLSKLPTATKIWLGSEKTLITTNDEMSFTSSSNSKFELLKTDGQWLKKGDHWGTLNPELLAAEREAYNLEESKIALQIDELEDSDIENLLKIEQSHTEISDKASELKQALKIDELSKETKERIYKALERLDKQLNRLKNKIDTEQYLLENSLKHQELVLSLKQKKRGLEALEYQSELKAAFDGKLSLRITQDKIQELSDKKLVWLPSNQIFAHIVDDRKLNVELTPTSSSLHSVAPEKVSLLIHLGAEGKLVRAKFKSVQLTENSQLNNKKWVFGIADKDAKSIKNAIGTQRVAYLFRELDEPAHLVMKHDIASVRPAILKEQGWRGLVRVLWPDSQVVFIGPQSIALRLKN